MNLFGEDDQPDPALTDLFSIFYAEYPRKEKNRDAHKAWKQVVTTRELALKIIGDVKLRSQNNWLGKEKIFIPLPGSYLRGERWTDEIYKNGNGEHESKSAALVRRQKESGDRVRDLLRRSTSDRIGDGNTTGANGHVRRRPLGS